MNRTVFLVDGFNLYHSLADARRDASKQTTKWLDLGALCRSYLPIAGRIRGEKAKLERIYYFSASPTHREPAKIERHKTYMRCLRATGIHVQLARFKRKDVFCRNCHSMFVAHEEKETDVAIAAKLFEVCHTDEADTVVLMTGDTDLAPAVRTCQRLFPTQVILFAFPYKRTNSELKELARESFSIKLRSCVRHQFADPLVLPDGARVPRPSSW